ncbi:MAG: triphosphoribosyl-dephospho-CoA synthase [Planctomycetales bacterium]|nr:triphosphoribosyl-dephospho-CoA synthase [Planctomycetales bacterium]
MSEPLLLSIGQCATLACLLEATAPKVGNVHRGADFEDLSFLDFEVSAAVIGPIVERAAEAGVGRTVFDAVRATRHWTATNSNLGMILLLAPLAAVPRDAALDAGVQTVLESLAPDDARLVYEAIRHAQPGGLGQADQMDVADEPPASLLDAMRAAADRDLIARQYANGFRQVFDDVVPWLADDWCGTSETTTARLPLTDRIIHAQLNVLAKHPDSLIARKCGPQVAEQASARAARTLAAGPPTSPDYLWALDDFDFWLRSDGHRRNPGTTADLIAAGLFMVLRDQRVQPPFQ